MRNDPRHRYGRSQDLLRRAERVIPLGSQTFSKSHIQFPSGAAPLFLTHGRGGRVWDVDGHEYVDMISGLLPVLLGYLDPDVDAAIRAQLERGIAFSLATDLEVEVAEKLVAMVPCAQMVRFGKNGSDATSGCVRIARAATGRDRVIACGYHGWHDWYIGATVRNKGVPDAVGELTHRVAYNDVAAVEALLQTYPGQIAALIMEPMNSVEPEDGYLLAVKQLVHRHGALLIFDEIITGFRYAAGGAQELFHVTPDLSAFGKGLGNGLPIAAIVGRTDLMLEMNEVFYSGTFGGEALSLAAANAVLDKLNREPVIARLWATGRSLADGLQALLDEQGLADLIRLRGKAPWTLLDIGSRPGASADGIRTFSLRTCSPGAY